MLKNKIPKKYMLAGIYCGIFALLLVCNVLTPYLVDDFRYMFSFYDGERIESLWDIVMSMRVHRYHMNGRIVAHTIVQLFAMLPAGVFDIVNALVYVLQIGLLHKIARWHESANPAVPVALFCGAWVCCPAFGQVNLWQDGACNYLWSIVFALLYLLPYIRAYLDGENVKTVYGKAMWLGIAFLMGAYSETVSAAAIFMSMLLLLPALVRKQKTNPISWAALGMAFLGYVFIYTAPAQWREKGAEMKFSVLFENFLNVTAMYWKWMGFLAVVFLLLLAVNIIRKTESKRMYLALVFFAGSLAANYIMMFASYYTTRSAIGAFAFLLGADGILLYPVMQKVAKAKTQVLVSVLILLMTVPFLIQGMKDISSTCRAVRSNEQTIYDCAEKGVDHVELPVVTAATKYSALDGLKYLDTETPDIWPNKYMATYYGVETILGVEAE